MAHNLSNPRPPRGPGWCWVTHRHTHTHKWVHVALPLQSPLNRQVQGGRQKTDREGHTMVQKSKIVSAVVRAISSFLIEAGYIYITLADYQCPWLCLCHFPSLHVYIYHFLFHCLFLCLFLCLFHCFCLCFHLNPVSLYHYSCLYYYLCLDLCVIWDQMMNKDSMYLLPVPSLPLISLII